MLPCCGKRSPHPQLRASPAGAAACGARSPPTLPRSRKQVEPASDTGLQECFFALGPLAQVVNCTEARPAVCEADPECGYATNVPTPLLNQLDQHVKVPVQRRLGCGLHKAWRMQHMG